jgi:AraC family transcriptional regulator of adaptative response / DNA-3-methyladenine glycosylase II
LRLIDEGFLDEGLVDELADRLGIGARHLHRLFVQHVGASPIAVAQTRRLHFAKRLLDETSLPITEIALAAGFGSLRRFNSAFQQTYGRAPRDLRRERCDGAGSQGGNEVVLKLAFRPPYDWIQVHNFLAARAVTGVERVDERGYVRTVAVGDSHGIICVRPIEDEDALELRVRGLASGALFQLASGARRVFDLTADPARIILAFRSDPLLAPLVKHHPGLRIPGAWDPFECAVRAVLGQQVSISAGRTLVARLVARAGRPLASSEEGLTHLFPAAADVAAADLVGLGLTGARIRALQALARAVANAKLSFHGPIEEVTTALAALPGIGAWTAQYVAMRALGEPDALPSADLGLLRALALNSSRELERRAECWRPWRAYAAMHIWSMANESIHCVERN